jgi:hypothetical protein
MEGVTVVVAFFVDVFVQGDGTFALRTGFAAVDDEVVCDVGG